MGVCLSVCMNCMYVMWVFAVKLTDNSLAVVEVVVVVVVAKKLAKRHLLCWLSYNTVVVNDV